MGAMGFIVTCFYGLQSGATKMQTDQQSEIDKMGQRVRDAEIRANIAEGCVRLFLEEHEYMTLSDFRLQDFPHRVVFREQNGKDTTVAYMTSSKAANTLQARWNLCNKAIETMKQLLAWAEEANNRLPAPATKEDRDRGFGCNPESIKPMKDARELLETIAKSQG
jgi:vacuolar-type H+-ATPase catalytic subunit A/Vma1